MWWPRSHAAQLPEKKTYGAGKRLPAGLASWSPAASPSARLPPLEPAVKNITDTADGPLVTGSVFGVEVTFLVGTGANVTILKPSVVNKIPVLERLSLECVDTSMLLTDGSSLPFQGCGRFGIQIGDQQVEHDVWVAEIEFDGIIGMDFIKEHNNIIVNWSGNVYRPVTKVCQSCCKGDNCYTAKK